MDVIRTPGAFSGCELTTKEPGRAVEFDGSLFGWRSDPMPMGEAVTDHVVKVGDTAVAGTCGPAPGSPPMPPSWGVYVTVTVADCDATVAKAQSLGAQLCAGPFDVPKVGRMAALQDPQGAVFNVMAHSPEMK